MISFLPAKNKHVKLRPLVDGLLLYRQRLSLLGALFSIPTAQPHAPTSGLLVLRLLEFGSKATGSQEPLTLTPGGVRNSFCPILGPRLVRSSLARHPPTRTPALSERSLRDPERPAHPRRATGQWRAVCGALLRCCGDRALPSLSCLARGSTTHIIPLTQPGTVCRPGKPGVYPETKPKPGGSSVLCPRVPSHSRAAQPAREATPGSAPGSGLRLRPCPAATPSPCSLSLSPPFSPFSSMRPTPAHRFTPLQASKGSVKRRCPRRWEGNTGHWLGTWAS